MVDFRFPSPMLTQENLDIAAKTVWAEARGEGEAGMRAVAAVIVNRALSAQSYMAKHQDKTRHPLFGDGGLGSASQAKWQFSCWNADDPNKDKMENLSPSDPAYQKAMDAVLWAVQNADPTQGASHYYASSIDQPAWAADATFTKKIGAHLFYKNVP